MRADADPTGAAIVHYTVTFAEPVAGVDAADFALATTGVSGASITGVSGSGSTYTVTVNTGTGNGTVGLNLVDDDSIHDGAANALGGAGAGNGNFTGQVYTVQHDAPTLTIDDPTVTEGDSGTVTLTFTVSLSSPAPIGGVTFDIATADGTATVADNDYVAKTLTAQTIPDGTSNYTFTVTVNGDATFEPNQTVLVNVTNVTGATVLDGQGSGTIVNDDAAPTPVINEIDSDQTGTDGAGFIELFGAANTSLTGYTLVLYNGSNDQSYRAFDLDGFSLDANGYFVLGNSGVPNVDFSAGITGDFLQNGADAVALYLGDATAFPNGTAVTAANLIDAVVYENNNPDDRGLIDVLTPGQAQVNENERSQGATQSLQRVTDGAGGPFNTTAFGQAAPTPGAANLIPATPLASATVTHLIHDVQGAGASSPLAAGTIVTIEGIVVGDLQTGDSAVPRSPNGFYLEEDTADGALSPLTSEGIFVFGGNTDVHEGDRVRITGTVSEFFGMTEVSVTGVTIAQANAMTDLSPLRVDIDLPTAGTTLNQNNDFQPDLEAYEGMLVRIPETLTITEQFNLDRFNEIKLSADGRLETYTNEFEPSVSGYAAYLQQIGARTITYDDGQNTQNESVNLLDGFDPDDDATGPSAVFPGEPGYTTASAYRMGDTVNGLTGVLDYQFAGDASNGSTWRIRAVNDGDNSFVHSNPREATPPDVGGTLKVGSFNVLNFFRTLDTSASATTAIGLEPRGANNAAEFQRQADKLVNFIATVDADVLGLTELENEFQPGNPGNAIEYIVTQLNARLGAGTYDWINPGSQLDNGQFFGGDAIAVGFIYKPSKVSVTFGTTIQRLDDADLDAAFLSQSTIGHVFNGVNTSRAVLAVTFHETATNEDFTAVINHFKSKSGNGTGADADQLDGQGAWQSQRELAAQALTQWIATHPTGTTDNDVLMLGDFNAYLKEDAVDLIEAGGFHNLAEERITDPYSFVFDAQAGALDHAFASNTLNGQVTGVAEWHTNADEADALDYNLDFDRDPRVFDANSTARESDHDPVLVGLALTSALTTQVVVSGQASFTLDAGDTLTVATGPAILWDLGPATVGNNATVDNSGAIRANSGRAIDTTGTQNGNNHFTLINHAGARITSPNDAIRINSDLPNGVVTIDNSGFIVSGSVDGAGNITGTGTGQALDFNITSPSVHTTITNNAGGLIGAGDADAIRPGVNATINNHGTIRAQNGTPTSTGNDGIDFQDVGFGASTISTADRSTAPATASPASRRHGRQRSRWHHRRARVRHQSRHRQQHDHDRPQFRHHHGPRRRQQRRRRHRRRRAAHARQSRPRRGPGNLERRPRKPSRSAAAASPISPAPPSTASSAPSRSTTAISAMPSRPPPSSTTARSPATTAKRFDHRHVRRHAHQHGHDQRQRRAGRRRRHVQRTRRRRLLQHGRRRRRRDTANLLGTGSDTFSVWSTSRP